jgi:hypothetical protein
MVYDDAGDQVVYRRDPRIRWPKRNHSILAQGVEIVNPIITLLFKLNKPKMEEKDCRDVQVLIDELANQASQAIGAEAAPQPERPRSA